MVYHDTGNWSGCPNPEPFLVWKRRSATPHHSKLALERNRFNGCSFSCPQAAGIGSWPPRHREPVREQRKKMDGWRFSTRESGHEKANKNSFPAHANSLLPVKPVKGWCITPITGLPCTATQTIVVTYLTRFSVRKKKEEKKKRKI